MSPLRSAVADAVFGWLWWSVFEIAVSGGSSYETAYRRAQRETRKLYP